ncbi:MAG: pilus assembly protein PilM [Phycisphaerales bacterium]
MRILGGRTLSPIGVELDGEWLHAAQLERTNGSWRTHAHCSIPVGSENDLALGVAALERQGFVGRRAVVAAERARLVSSMVEAPPPDSPAPRDEIIRHEIARLAECGAESIEVGSWAMNAAADGATIAVAYRKADANRWMDRFESVGLDVQAIDCESLAIHRACEWLYDSEHPGVVIVCVGHSSSLVMVTRSHGVVFQRVHDGFGRSIWRDQIREQFNIDEEVADYILERAFENSDASENDAGRFARRCLQEQARTLGREIVESVEYVDRYLGDGSTTQLWMTGVGGSIGGLASALGAETGFAARTVTPSDCVSGGALASGDAGQVTAIGLAMHGSGDG